MDKVKPIIGVTIPDSGNFFAYIFIYMQIFIAGGKAVKLTPNKHLFLNKIDSLVFSGGSDINPIIYNKERDDTKEFDNKRDAFEIQTLKYAIKKELPILGICRGAQLINSIFGGDLYPTIESFNSNLIHKNSILPIKKASIDKSSKLYSIIKSERIYINSLHNQAINIVGKSLKRVAFSKMELTQAIEKINYPFLIGVQWHPEYLIYLKSHRSLFKALVKESINKKLKINE